MTSFHHAGGHELVCVRHGETEWSRDGRHTGRSDIPLTSRGRESAKALGEALSGWRFVLVLTSPLLRASDTAALAGYGDVVEMSEDLLEWDYGEYDGVTTATIRETVPGWTVWTHGAKGGEAADAVAARADRVIASVRAADGPVLVFAHGHYLRVLAARWLGFGPAEGRLFGLDPATISVLGWERETPVVRRWNAPP